MAQVVLVVDDSATIRNEVRTALLGSGLDVEEATDGLDAWEKIAGGASVSAIICDVNMPRMDGLQLLERLKEEGISIPTVMLTTEGQPELIQRAKAAGAKGWIVKPFNSELLVKAMKKVVEG